MASRRSQVVDVTYDDDYRTGEKGRERRVQAVQSWDEMDHIRNRELALFRATSPQRRDDMIVARRDDRDDDDDNDDNQYIMRRTITRERFADNNARLAPPRRKERPRSSRRRTPSPSSSSSEEPARERRRHRRRHRRAASQRQASPADSADEGILWYSHKRRGDGNILERNLDCSYDGIIAGIAGAAIGGITARRFGGEEKRGWKMLGGAIAGGVAFNAIENKYRVYTEVREKKNELAFEAGEPLELAGEVAQNI